MPPAIAVGGLTYALTSTSWAGGFLPETFIVLLPFPLTASLSAVFVCALAALWSAHRPLRDESDSGGDR